jgi:hypothetical protein
MKNKLLYYFVIILLISISISTSGSIVEISELNNNKYYFNSPESNVLVRINNTENFSLIPKNLEIAGGRPNEWFDIIIPKRRLKELDFLDIVYSVINWDLDRYLQSFKSEYHSLEEMEDILNGIADNYSHITKLYSIGKTYEDRDIWCLEISDNPGEDEVEPGVFLMGLHHAREWPSLEICLYVANELTSNYSLNPNITKVVNTCRIWLVACVNPDGYYYSHDLGVDWRKNRHYFPEFDEYGVDNNRNYGGSCNGDSLGAWGSIGKGSVSHHADQGVYCGPGAFSELETKAIRDIFIDNDICAAISWHTYGELVLWPWGYSKIKQTPDDTYLKHVGEQIASRIDRQTASDTYRAYQASNLYPTTGDTTDWAYGYSHYILGRPTFAYTIEACKEYQPPIGYLDQIIQENFEGALYLLQEAENISKTVSHRVLPPLIKNMSSDADGNYTVSWKEQNPDADPDFFQLDELSNAIHFIDDGESGSTSWNNDGFSLSKIRSHSGDQSYKSRYLHKDVSSMTTVNPIPITNGINLTFWCWYNIEEEWDYAFVEVSRDGRCYDILDKFTGKSNGWIFKEYNLNNFINDSIFIRFRYTTDTNKIKEGFYVDDIFPVANYSSIITLTNSTNDNYFEINNKDEGYNYYRVRGHNSEYGWGDFTTLESMHIIKAENSAPDVPSINGSISGKAGQEYEYEMFTNDSDGDNLYFFIDWGDDTCTGWFGPYSSDEKALVNHKWKNKGSYLIKVKAKDIHNEKTDWTKLEVTMPKYRISINNFIIWFINHHPLLYNILRNLINK